MWQIAGSWGEYSGERLLRVSGVLMLFLGYVSRH